MTGRTLRWLISLVRGPERVDREGAPVGRLTIIRQHRVYGDEERPLYRLGVSQRVLAEQLDLLARLGLAPVTAEEGLRRLESGRAGHWVAMTFDDGYQDNVRRALPLLESRSARATFYLAAGWIEERRAPWWDELAQALEGTRERRLRWSAGGRPLDLPLGSRAERARALRRLLSELRVDPGERGRRLGEVRTRLGVADPAPCELMTWGDAAALVRAGMEVGAHGLDHPRLSTIGPEAQRREIRGSVELIERRLGIRPRGFAYPEGDHDPGAEAAVAECGLRYAVTTRAGVNRADASRYRLRRRGLPEGACLGPAGRFSRRLATAELHGAFDRLRRVEATP